MRFFVAVFLILVSGAAAQAPPESLVSDEITLEWEIPENTSNIFGYRLYHGLQSGVYDRYETAVCPTTTRHTMSGIDRTVNNYFVAKSFGAAGDTISLSEASNEVMLPRIEPSITLSDALRVTVEGFAPGSYEIECAAISRKTSEAFRSNVIEFTVE